MDAYLVQAVVLLFANGGGVAAVFLTNGSWDLNRWAFNHMYEFIGVAASGQIGRIACGSWTGAGA